MKTTAAAPQNASSLPPGGPAVMRWNPEQQLVGYRQREKIDPVRAVGRGAHVHHLPLAIHQISPRWTWDSQDMDLDRYMDAERVSGVIVLKDGQIVLQRYGLGRTEKDRWVSMSVAKSVTSILVGAAIQDGYIENLDAPVTDYIRELKGSVYEGVTIRHLLTMTTGVKWDEDTANPNSDVSLSNWSMPEPGANPLVAYMRRLQRADPPGAKFAYKSCDADLAAILVTTAVGKSLCEYLSDKIWRSYGMEEDAFWVVDRAGHEIGGGGISATLRDYARIGQFMLDGGKAGAVQVLPPEWLKDANRAHVVFPPADLGATGYGYFWWIFKDAYAAVGFAGQAIFVYPSDKIVIAINSAWPGSRFSERREARYAFVETLRAAAVAQPPVPSRHFW